MPRNRLSGLASLFEGFSYEWEQGDVASLLDGGGDHSLMTRTGARLAAGADLAIFGDVLPKHISFLVVNCQRLIRAELTEFGLREKAAIAASFGSSLGSSIFSHLLLQFLSIQKPVCRAACSYADQKQDGSQVHLEGEFILVRCHITFVGNGIGS